LLWGAFAQKKAQMIDGSRHRILQAAHPSPLSAKKFFGSKPFSSTNAALKEVGQEPINWQLPAEPGEAPAPASAPSGKAAAAPVAAKVDGAPAKPPAKAAPAPAPVVPKEPPTVLEGLLPADWRSALAEEIKKPSFR